MRAGESAPSRPRSQGGLRRSAALARFAPILGSAPVAATIGCLLLYSALSRPLYFHDGVFFVELVEAGALRWVHVAYLPVARVLVAATSWLEPSATLVLQGLSVLSASAAVGLSLASLRSFEISRPAMLFTGLLLAISPALLFSACTPEIHSFAAFGAALGAWIATRPSIGVGARSALALLVAPSTHQLNVLMAPFLVALALRTAARRRGRTAGRDVLHAVLGALLATIVAALAARWVSEQSAGPDVVRVLAGASLDLASSPAGLVAKLPDSLLAPWGWVGVLALSGYVLASFRDRALSIFLGLHLAGMFLALSTGPSNRGQFGTVLAPSIALGAALAVRSLRTVRPSALRIGALLLLASHIAISGSVLRDWMRDGDREWARASGTTLRESDVVLAFGPRRRRVLQEESRAGVVDAFDLESDGARAAEATARRAWELAMEQEGGLYVDPALVEASERFPPLRDLVRTFRLRHSEDVPLVEVAGLRGADARDRRPPLAADPPSDDTP